MDAMPACLCPTLFSRRPPFHLKASVIDPLAEGRLDRARASWERHFVELNFAQLSVIAELLFGDAIADQQISVN